MPMPLDRWDQEVAPHLHGIKLDAGWLRHYVKSILERCHKLAIRPVWEAIAEDEIKRTIAVLEEALVGLKKAHQVYLEKPPTA